MEVQEMRNETDRLELGIRAANALTIENVPEVAHVRAYVVTKRTERAQKLGGNMETLPLTKWARSDGMAEIVLCYGVDNAIGEANFWRESVVFWEDSARFWGDTLRQHEEGGHAQGLIARARESLTSAQNNLSSCRLQMAEWEMRALGWPYGVPA
jgi:hypothetical protein